ncbi:hypothetical protein pipiens_001672 [Culex pipiens pipiens]|uniref:Odorant-binding protein n=2 Tax=Culex pipiens TaxID=7175 RepID=A0ABD1CD17_CULPP
MLCLQDSGAGSTSLARTPRKFGLCVCAPVNRRSSCSRTMKLVAVTVFVLLTKTSPSLALEGSFRDAQERCFQYLNVHDSRWEEFQDVSSYPADEQAKQLVRCIGLMLRFWDDCEGVNAAVIKTFFQPDCSDQRYLNRTNECLQDIRVQNVAGSETYDVLTVVFETFHCYYHQYGNLVDLPQFIPWTANELLQIEDLCRNILTSSPPQPVDDLGRPPCLSQCFLLQAGFWSASQAVLLDRVHLQYGRGEEQDVFIRKVTNCVDLYRQQHDNSCILADQYMRHCFHHESFINRSTPSQCVAI